MTESKDEGDRRGRSWSSWITDAWLDYPGERGAPPVMRRTESTAAWDGDPFLKSAVMPLSKSELEAVWAWMAKEPHSAEVVPFRREVSKCDLMVIPGGGYQNPTFSVEIPLRLYNVLRGAAQAQGKDTNELFIKALLEYILEELKKDKGSSGNIASS